MTEYEKAKWCWEMRHLLRQINRPNQRKHEVCIEDLITALEEKQFSTGLADLEKAKKEIDKT